MKSSKYAPGALLFGAFALLNIGLLSGCGSQTTSDDAKIISGHVSDSGQASRPNNIAPISENGLTLPLLDALFYEEGFEQELKTKLQLTEQQIQKLKVVSRASVEDLTEDGNSAHPGSARAASKRFEEQMKSILGDQKAGQLLQLISERYAGGVEGLLPTQPNAVPKDTRIVINAPAYRMDVFQDGQLLKTYKVGIGYPEFPLPTGMRRAETIIFNPTWTPPDEPWVKGKFKAGEKVDAGSKDNPLGPIKIPIGAPSLIHGGKALSKLGNFASHGCVGLTNDQVKEFAVTLARLSGSSLDSTEVRQYGKQKTETKSVKLAKPVPVELRYETIVAENGGLHIYRDVYERGTNTVDNARHVLDVYGISYDQLPPQERQALLQALTEMNRDAAGNPIVENISQANDTTAQDSEQNNDPTKSANARKGKETKTIVGRKDILVPIAALQGKGYPAPVNLNSGIKPAASFSGSKRH
jgi:lipoprotein-anchoring transpeptidase ErfK/SrfK